MKSSSVGINTFLFESNPASMIIFNRDTLRILKVNNASIDTYGYSEEEFLKLTVKDIRPKEDVPVLMNNLEATDKKLKGPHFRHQKKNGKIFYVQISSCYFDWEDTNAQLAVIHDVSDEVEAQVKAEKAEKEAEEQQRFSEMLIKNLPDTFWLMDSEGNVIQWNEQLEKTSGFSKEEIQGRFVLDFFADEEHSTLRATLAKVFSEGKATTEGTLITKSGEAIPHALTGIKFIYGDEPYMAGIGVDIKEQKDRQLRLEKTSDQLIRALHIAQMGSWEMHFADMQLSWSDEMYELFGLPEGDIDLTFENFLSYVPAEERSELQKELKAAMTGEWNGEIEHRIITNQGEIRHVVERGEIDYDENNNPVKVSGTMQDITQRKKNEQIIEKESLRFELATRATSDVIWDWDFSENKIWWSEGLRTVFGYRDYEAASDPDWWEQQIHPEDQERAEKSIIDFLASDRRYWSLKGYKFRNADGSISYVDENGYVIRDEEGKAVRMIGAMKDITKRKKSELRIQESLEEKEALLAEIHHRVKNNLAIISSLLELQLMSEDDEHVKHILKDSQSRIFSMAKVHELLYQTGDFTNIPFEQYIIEIIDHISTTLTKNDIEFQFNNNVQDLFLDINQAIPCALIINEVINNAIEHAFVDKESGNIFITLDKNEKNVEIEITDDGVGIPKNMLNRNHSPTSLGHTLINTLTHQVGGNGKYSITEKGGTSFKLEFKAEKKQGSSNTLF